MFGSGKILVAMITVKGEGSKEMTDHCSLLTNELDTQNANPFLLLLPQEKQGRVDGVARARMGAWMVNTEARHDIAEAEITEIALWVFTVATVPLVYLLL